MDELSQFLEIVRAQDLAQGNLRGLLHILIGRRITRTDGTLVSAGMSWRDLAAMLKKVRWSPESVTELGVDPATLPLRDRQRYWYTTITLAQVDSAEAASAGDRLAEALQPLGYVVGPAPRRS